MDCKEVEELAGAIALRALPDAEAAEVSAHLASCADAHALVTELLDVVDLLPLSVDEREPPAGLRDRLLAAATGGNGGGPLAFPGERQAAVTPAGAVATQAQAVRGSDAPTLLRPATRHLWWRSPVWLVAAALFVAVIGLGVWVGSLQHRLDQRDGQHRVEQQVLAAVANGDRVVPIAGSDLKAFLVQPREGGTAYVVGAMPSVPDNKAYEAWVIRDGKPVPVGVFKPGGGYAVMPIQSDLQGAQAVAFTVEPEQGSATPTLPIVAQFPLG
jgi:anti-sigma-K factor RskA